MCSPEPAGASKGGQSTGCGETGSQKGHDPRAFVEMGAERCKVFDFDLVRYRSRHADGPVDLVKLP